MAARAFSLNSALATSSKNNIKSTIFSALQSDDKSSLKYGNFLPAISRSSLVLNRRKEWQVLSMSSGRQRFESHCLKAKPLDGGETAEENAIVISATSLVIRFYDAINRRDMKALGDLVAEDCVFNDLQFPQAFEGKKGVLKFAEDLMEAMGKDIKFAIDSTAEGDDYTTMVLWHLEWRGKTLPSTKGCSLYRCEIQGTKLLIRFVQGFIESPIKPGELILKFLKIISSLFEQYPIVAQSIL